MQEKTMNNNEKTKNPFPVPGAARVLTGDSGT